MSPMNKMAEINATLGGRSICTNISIIYSLCLSRIYASVSIQPSDIIMKKRIDILADIQYLICL
jgi:hypothetical protein